MGLAMGQKLFCSSQDAQVAIARSGFAHATKLQRWHWLPAFSNYHSRITLTACMELDSIVFGSTCHSWCRRTCWSSVVNTTNDCVLRNDPSPAVAPWLHAFSNYHSWIMLTACLQLYSNVFGSTCHRTCWSIVV